MMNNRIKIMMNSIKFKYITNNKIIIIMSNNKNS
jgi:hypothetical protein